MPGDTLLVVNAARNVAPTTMQRPWRVLNRSGITHNGSLPTADQYLHSLTRWVTDLAVGRLVTPVLEPHAAVRFRYWHVGADGSQAKWVLFGVTEVWPSDDVGGQAGVLEYTADLLVEFTTTAGQGMVPAGSMLAPAGARYCDTITVTDAYAPGTVELDMDAPEGAMNMCVEGAGYPVYMLVGSIDGAGTDPTSIGAQLREQ